jgi:hypothetical protein
MGCFIGYFEFYYEYSGMQIYRPGCRARAQSWGGNAGGRLVWPGWRTWKAALVLVAHAHAHVNHAASDNAEIARKCASRAHGGVGASGQEPAKLGCHSGCPVLHGLDIGTSGQK